MGAIDVAELKQRTSIVSVVSKHVNLVKRGAEHIGVCPFHDDHKSSLKVNESKSVFKCFACGVSGDAIKFLTLKGYSFKEAVDEINGSVISVSPQFNKRDTIPKKTVEWKQILPEEADFDSLPDKHYEHGAISRKWTYTDRKGLAVGFICRFDLPDGSKEVVPLIFATDGKKKEWKWRGFNKPRPLYNLHKIHQNPTKTILVVEGEKTADAGELLFPQLVVTTWQGGANSIHNICWDDLDGRDLIFWADKDWQGYEAMIDIISILREKASSIRWVKNPTGIPYPLHWDLADADWTPEKAFEHMKNNIKTIKK